MAISDKEVERVARLYYADYCDEREVYVDWCQLAVEQQKHWRAFARRRLERDS